jgi:hypothetical protein
MCRFGVVVAAVLVAPLAARADYYTVGDEFVLSNRLHNGDRYGYFAVWTNDGRGASNVVSLPPFPQPGQVQFQYSVGSQPWGKDYPDSGPPDYFPLPVYGNDYHALRVDGFAFNTNLNLSASQFAFPAAWTLKRNGQIDGFGTFSWVASATSVNSFQNYGTFTINNLGPDAIPAHFMLTSQPDPGAPPPSGMVYAAIHISGLTPSALDSFATEHWIGVATLTTPEPGSLTLVMIGLASSVVLVTRRALGDGRFRSWHRHRTALGDSVAPAIV